MGKTHNVIKGITMINQERLRFEFWGKQIHPFSKTWLQRSLFLTVLINFNSSQVHFILICLWSTTCLQTILFLTTRRTCPHDYIFLNVLEDKQTYSSQSLNLRTLIVTHSPVGLPFGEVVRQPELKQQTPTENGDSVDIASLKIFRHQNP